MNLTKKLKRNVNAIIKLSFFISYYLFIILLINIVGSVHLIV